jgi:hypothetical protein
MRVLPSAASVLAAAVALSGAGCFQGLTPEQQRALKREIVRHFYLEDFGPQHVASVVGGGGPGRRAVRPVGPVRGPGLADEHRP